jgi:ATP-dependent exoDNAse (exonuclease V) beta subunit
MSFTVYRSSAGSGKTFTLVKEYLKIILQDTSGFRNILAITFTNKAANELKERVLEALNVLSEYRHSDPSASSGILMNLLKNETGLNTDEIVSRASETRKLILHKYSEFAIGTIDSFSHRVVKTFAHDFRIPVDFTVELDSDQLLETAVDLLLERTGRDEELTRLLLAFIETRMDEEEGWVIGRILKDFAYNLMDDQGVVRIESLGKTSLNRFFTIARELSAANSLFESQLRSFARTAMSLLDTHGITVKDIYQGDRGAGAYLKRIAEGNFSKLDPSDTILKAVSEDKWAGPKTNNSIRASIEGIQSDLASLFRNISEFKQDQGPGYLARKILAKSIYPLAVLNEIDQILSEFKHRNNIVHISEFNARISSVILNESIPFIYERLGEKYHHILIDEFQDTSILQWLNLMPLVENALAGGYFNLLVGDGKQAIYRWRGGDIDQFAALPSIPGSRENQILFEREQTLKQHFNLINLDRNFRSKAEIVKFNNDFFSWLSESVLPSRTREIYRGLVQEYNVENTGGYVSIDFLQGGQNKENYQTDTLERITGLIDSLKDSGYRWQDIAILTRSNDSATLIASHLLKNGIEVVSAESLLIRNSAKVKFLVAMLRNQFNPVNPVVQEEIRRFLLNAGNGKPVDPDHLKERYVLKPLYELCETIVRDFCLCNPPDAYVISFLAFVSDFSGKRSQNSIEFLSWWEQKERSLSISVPEALNAVKVMTIHKAKGLQFPVVIFPFAVQSRKPGRKWLWTDLPPDLAPGLNTAILRTGKELSETIFNELYEEEMEKSMLDMVNLLYVAMTRPEERLYILTEEPPEKSGQMDSLPKMFAGFLDSVDRQPGSDGHVEIGSPAGKSEKNKLILQSSVVNEFISNDWRTKISVRKRGITRGFADLNDDSTLWGISVHKILSWIITVDQLPVAIDRAIRSGLITLQQREALYSKLNSLLNHPLLVNYYSERYEIRNEPEILDPDGTFYRPDRVAISKDQIGIIDYKTGKKHPGHLTQLSGYASLLSKMGYRKIHCLLVYIEPEIEVVELNAF